MSKRFNKTTKELSDILGKAGKEAALTQYLEDLKKDNDSPALSTYLNEILAQKQLTVSALVRNSGLRKEYVYNIFGGNRSNPSRSKMICICLGCHMTLVETQRALEIAGTGVLYPRRPEDAVIIYNINRENWSVVDINIQLDERGLPLIEQPEE